MTARSENVAPKSNVSEKGMPPTHTSSVRGTDFTIDARYRVQKFVGCGSYGVVCAAIDTRDQVRPPLVAYAIHTLLPASCSLAPRSRLSAQSTTHNTTQ